MLINFSNHPSHHWNKKQMSQAKKLYGSVFDMSFPEIDPEAGEDEIHVLAVEYYKKLMRFFEEKGISGPHAVHIQGEFSFVCAVVALLTAAGITCVASTTRRIVTTRENGEKISRFDFVRFRKYVNLVQ